MGRRISDKLKRLIGEMPHGLRSELVRQLERARLRGEAEPAHDVILNAARACFREKGESVPRIVSPMRLVCGPLETFLTDRPPSVKQPGRIARASLTPVWNWLNRDIGAEAVAPLAEEIVRAVLVEEDEAKAAALGENLTDAVAAALSEAVNGLAKDPVGRRRAVAQIGSESAFLDAVDIALVLRTRRDIDAFASRLPRRIGAVDEETANLLLTAVDRASAGDGNRLALAFAVLQQRLSDPLHLLVIARHALGTDDAAKFAGHRYGAALDLVVADLDAVASGLKRDLAEGDANAAVAMLKRYHAMTRGINSLMDMTGLSPWRKRMGELRREASKAVEGAIANAPALTRRAIHPTSGQGRQTVFDAGDADRAAFAIRLFVAARNAADALALNELLSRLGSSLEVTFESSSEALVGQVRRAQGGVDEDGMGRVAAALEIAGILFGDEYAAVLRRAIATAAHGVALTQAR